MKEYTEKELMKKWPMDEIPDAVREFAVAWGVPFHLDIRDTVKLARDMLNVYEVLNKHLIDYLDKQIDNCNSHKESFEVCYNDIFNRGQLFTLRTIREKFLTLTPTP